MPEHYEGVHAHVFLHKGVDVGSVTERLGEDVNRRVGPVYFISALAGDFSGFAHVAHDDLLTLADYIDGRLWDAGFRGSYAVEARWYIGRGPKPKGPTRNLIDYIAICRVFGNLRPTEVLANVAGFFGDEETPLLGAATVIGDFDVLVELGDHDREALNRHVASLREVNGVARVEVGFAAPGALPSS